MPNGLYANEGPPTGTVQTEPVRKPGESMAAYLARVEAWRASRLPPGMFRQNPSDRGSGPGVSASSSPGQRGGGAPDIPDYRRAAWQARMLGMMLGGGMRDAAGNPLGTGAMGSGGDQLPVSGDISGLQKGAPPMQQESGPQEIGGGGGVGPGVPRRGMSQSGGGGIGIAGKIQAFKDMYGRLPNEDELASFDPEQGGGMSFGSVGGSGIGGQ